MRDKTDNWIHEINVISKIVQRILSDKETFEAYFEIIKNNPRTNIRNHHFHLWVTRCYFTHILMNIRTLTDQGTGNISLLNTLTDIQKNNDLVNINWYKSKFKYGNSDSDYKTISNGADCINKTLIGRDKSALILLSKNINKYVNNHMAHKSKNPTLEVVPKYNDICLFYTRFEEIFRKYYLLLTARGIISLTPTVQDNWQEIFCHKWIDNNAREN